MRNILQHYPKSEHIFIKNAYRKIENNYQNDIIQEFSFLSPREINIVKSFLKKDTKYKIFPESEEYEKRKLIILPSYIDVVKDNDYIQVYKINYNMKFSKIEHPDIMGTLYNMSVDTKYIGDIFYIEDIPYIIVDKKIANFIDLELTKIGKTVVGLEKVEMESIDKKDSDFKDYMIVCKGLRIDLLISQVFNISRKESQKLISKKKVIHNYLDINDSTIQITQDDNISVQKHGKIKIVNIEKTSKQRYKVYYRGVFRNK